MKEYRQLDNVPPSLSAEEFFKKYIATRTPVVVRGLLNDEEFRARNWTDLTYLKKKAGDSEVLIEPMHPASKQYGTDIERVPTKFADFLDGLQRAEGPHPYLTTQYAEQDLDALTALPPPADALADDFPRVPRLMGNLFLQQVNLWLGRSKAGTTSGLHHDFHDNLYCLLKGKKRFVLFSPKETEHLYPYGKLDKLHANGLISYADAPVRSDGLSSSIALKARVKALERKLESIPPGKGKGKQNAKERQALVDAYDAALDELAKEALEGINGVELEDVEDDLDALMGGMSDDVDGFFEDGSLEELAAPGVEDDEESEEEEEEGALVANGNEDEESAEAEPSSFSRIPAAFMHQHLKLATTAVLPPDFAPDDFPDLQKAPKPFVVELNANEMLYLPASWWHEVTSFSTGDDENDVHMAFNYWFYPPDKLDDFEQPYEDALVWDYFKSRDESVSSCVQSDSESLGAQRTGKRTAQDDGPRDRKKAKA